MRQLDIDSWDRKEHYAFFKAFEEPFFGLTVGIDCTVAHKHCKEHGISFFLYYLHKTLKAANGIESFRYRIIDDKVMIFDHVHGSATINRPNGTFGFSYIEYRDGFTDFLAVANKEIERVQSTTGLIPAVSGENVMHISSLPWINFTSLSHARSFSFNDSCPKISYGKMTEREGRKSMPVSIHVHHALMDGVHVAQFIEDFQRLMDQDQ